MCKTLKFFYLYTAILLKMYYNIISLVKKRPFCRLKSQEGFTADENKLLMRTTYLKIYLDALRHNLRAIRALVPKHTETVAVVKANSYGYGAVQVAAMAMEEGYEALAVAVTSCRNKRSKTAARGRF